MRLSLHCPICDLPEEPEFSVQLLPKNDCNYEIVCPRGHHFSANILYHEFQKLFEVGVNTLADDYYREAIGSLATSYEKFIELFIGIVMRTKNVDPDVIENAWKHVSRLSERQLGAFIYLYSAEFNNAPPLLSKKLVELRNKVVHKGYFPERQECIDYGAGVLSSIRQAIVTLHNSDQHRDELIRSINYQGDFSPTGPRLHYLAHPLIATNSPPERDTKGFDEMVHEAIAARRVSQ